MIKKYVNFAIVYAIIAMVMGVFYREFTKLMGFDGFTSLSIIHVHYLALGMLFFLILALLEKSFAFSETGKSSKVAIVLYTIGLNVAVLMFFVRGVTQVLGTELIGGANAAISGVAGIGHMLLAVGLVMILLKVKKAAQ